MSIDYYSAKNAINQCIDSISYTYSNDVVNNGGILKTNWDANANSIYTNALNKLINTRYKELKDELNKCLSLLDNMSNIEKLEEESAYYTNQITYKNSELKVAEQFDESKKGSSATYYSGEAIENRKKIKKLEEEIRELREKKAEIDDKIYDYKNA